jgi:hypothetical protein
MTTRIAAASASVARMRAWLSDRPIKRGIEAGLIASVPQVLLAKTEEWLLMPPGEDADLGPRFVERLAQLQGERVCEDTKWLAASAFHFGYAIFWGAAYALAYRRWQPHPLLGGTALGTLIYAITFPHWGGAVLMGTERPPHRRSWRQELVLATAAMSFGLGTALLYGRAKTPRNRVASIAPQGDEPMPSDRRALRAGTLRERRA